MALTNNSGLVLPVGVPRGGSTGEVLTKTSATDWDIEWAAGGGGSSDFIPGKTVANFAALPSVVTYSGYLAICLAAQGVWMVNYKAKGIYYSDGATWLYQGDYELTDEASEIGFTPYGIVTATNVQAAIEQVSDSGNESFTQAFLLMGG